MKLVTLTVCAALLIVPALANRRGSLGSGCCPKIVPGPHGSVIEPFTGYRGNVAIIVDRGSCTVADKGFV